MGELSHESVRAAAGRLEGRIRRTPALRCEELEDAVGAELWLKCENLQYIGAFKARGAMHAVGRLAEADRRRGVITYSSGNHAQAVALAARRFGIRADIAMPEDAPAVKVARVRALGAHIVFAGTTSTERREAALRLQADTGAPIIEPFDHPDIIAAQGTATLELFDQVHTGSGGPLDALIVPVGGGGLIAGACLAAENSDADIYAVEPVGCDSFGRSLRAGEVVAVQPGPTLADGLKPTRVGRLNFDIARRRVTDAFTVTDDEVGPALTRLLTSAKLLVEPSAAAALAVALRGGLPRAPRRVGVLLSGGNIAPELLARLLEGVARVRD